MLADISCGSIAVIYWRDLSVGSNIVFSAPRQKGGHRVPSHLSVEDLF